jgi:hypothetical protein
MASFFKCYDLVTNRSDRSGVEELSVTIHEYPAYLRHSRPRELLIRFGTAPGQKKGTRGDGSGAWLEPGRDRRRERFL